MDSNIQKSLKSLMRKVDALESELKGEQEEQAGLSESFTKTIQLRLLQNERVLKDISKQLSAQDIEDLKEELEDDISEAIELEFRKATKRQEMKTRKAEKALEAAENVIDSINSSSVLTSVFSSSAFQNRFVKFVAPKLTADSNLRDQFKDIMKRTDITEVDKTFLLKQLKNQSDAQLKFLEAQRENSALFRGLSFLKNVKEQGFLKTALNAGITYSARKTVRETKLTSASREYREQTDLIERTINNAVKRKEFGESLGEAVTKELPSKGQQTEFVEKIVPEVLKQIQPSLVAPKETAIKTDTETEKYVSREHIVPKNDKCGLGQVIGKILGLLGRIWGVLGKGAGQIGSGLKALGKLPVSKLAKIGGIGSALFGGYERYQEVKGDKTLTTGQKVAKVGSSAIGAGLGGMSGAALGATIGAIGGPIGIAVGAGIGGWLGGEGGKVLGDMFGDYFSDEMKPNGIIGKASAGVAKIFDTFGKIGSGIATSLGTLANKASNAASNAWLKGKEKAGQAYAAGKSFVGKAVDLGKEGIGKISTLFETGGKGSSGAGVISSGKGDFGGKSYGSHQFTKETVKDYLSKSKYGAQFKGLGIGTAQFDAKWRQLAQQDPGFAQDQEQYTTAKYYGAQSAKLKSQGLDLTNRSKALQSAVYSVGVQFGGGSNLVMNAIKEAKLDPKSASDEDIIKAIYAFKRGHNEQLFKKSSAQVRAGTLGRASKEEATVLASLKTEKSAGTASQVTSGPVVAKTQAPAGTPAAASGGKSQAVALNTDATPTKAPAPISVHSSGKTKPNQTVSMNDFNDEFSLMTLLHIKGI